MTTTAPTTSAANSCPFYALGRGPISNPSPSPAPTRNRQPSATATSTSSSASSPTLRTLSPKSTLRYPPTSATISQDPATSLFASNSKTPPSTRSPPPP